MRVLSVIRVKAALERHVDIALRLLVSDEVSNLHDVVAVANADRATFCVN